MSADTTTFGLTDLQRMMVESLPPLLQDIAPFQTPKIELEQYPTGAHLASRLLYTASPPRAPAAHRSACGVGAP